MVMSETYTLQVLCIYVNDCGFPQVVASKSVHMIKVSLRLQKVYHKWYLWFILLL